MSIISTYKIDPMYKLYAVVVLAGSFWKLGCSYVSTQNAFCQAPFFDPENRWVDFAKFNLLMDTLGIGFMEAIKQIVDRCLRISQSGVRAD